MNKKLFNSIVKISLVSMVLAMSFQFLPANAASFTYVKDTMNRLIENQTTGISHTIVFTTATAVSGGAGANVVEITFPDAEDGDWCATAGSLVATGTNAGEGATPLPGTLAVSCAQGSGASSYDTITITGVNDLSISTKYGVLIDDTGASTGDLGTPAAGNDKLIMVTTNDGTLDVDDGYLAVSILSDDQVVITGTVGATFTFTITDNAIGFGALTSANARYATADATGSDSDTVSAHDMTVATNADNGYAVTYLGPTLTSGSNTIDVAAITDSATGTAGTEEFGLSIDTDGDATITTGYDHNATPANRDWAWVASTTTSIISETGPTATETFGAYYLANIATTTEPGIYTSTITYIATGNF